MTTKINPVCDSGESPLACPNCRELAMLKQQLAKIYLPDSQAAQWLRVSTTTLGKWKGREGKPQPAVKTPINEMYRLIDILSYETTRPAAVIRTQGGAV